MAANTPNPGLKGKWLPNMHLIPTHTITQRLRLYFPYQQNKSTTCHVCKKLSSRSSAQAKIQEAPNSVFIIKYQKKLITVSTLKIMVSVLLVTHYFNSIIVNTFPIKEEPTGVFNP
ncbi:unnamed protein product [Cuscuta campestris]|uniref:Uncharacterized protein n=1 Tax=Cuscuta campestris TaxID=132261 RepID=A0A484K8T3_9ASTE|nr:unnamed protein product [Cuscuta campestris]